MKDSRSYRQRSASGVPHGFAFRQGFNAGWRNQPMPANACPAYRNGWHIGRMRLLKAELDAWGVMP